MAKLNCRVGDLAITVRSNIPDNVGLVVRIVDICMYLDEWKDLEGPVHIWDVDLVCEDSRLVCFSPYQKDFYISQDQSPMHFYSRLHRPLI
ncbi:MAG: hypothetical protein RJA18_1374 [Pseudomonadota bacterium]